MSKSQLKKLLAGMSKEEVVNVVMELYDAIMDWSWPCGYGFHDETGDAFCKLAPPQYHSKVDDADALGDAQYYAMHPSLKRR